MHTVDRVQGIGLGVGAQGSELGVRLTYFCLAGYEGAGKGSLIRVVEGLKP